MHNYPGPGSPQPENTRAAVLGEFGGLGLAVDGHRWTDKNWGYRGTADSHELTAKYLELWRNVRKLCDEKGLSAAVYTQLTDVETECNGLMTYDRAVMKVDAKQAYDALVNGKFPPEPVPKTAEKKIAWLLSKPGVTPPIVGATKIEHLDAALAAVELRLGEEEIRQLETPYQPHAVRGFD